MTKNTTPAVAPGTSKVTANRDEHVAPSSASAREVGRGAWPRRLRCRRCRRPETLHCPGCAACWPDDACGPVCDADPEECARLALAIGQWEGWDDPPAAGREPSGQAGDRLSWLAVYANPEQAAEIGCGAGWFITATTPDDEPRVVLAVELAINGREELAARSWAELLAAQLAVALPRLGALTSDYGPLPTSENVSDRSEGGRR